ncbi:flagellar protein [Bradyrhizobium sp. 83012]|uniref:Flagellar protein n=1 Tax=Bradyrhizobium aeschynomenes TaxID=2734909 RepID=A0ABX2CNG7_9BRAD|nr:flagellar protein [Bradyrhizobium aeschynomenes]NPU12542.1 flagellar protein [Bradyrhizobium aeschynomenes]NPU69753.1 flagellar protein [Bradyrhizobium aeschynomenes]NPV23098.1 flagellar protein [Bradyrhizobium aeschynomenes]
MSISSINYGTSLLGLSVRNISNQLADLSTQLSSGVKANNYAGMGPDEGFAIAARAQLSNIAGFTTTMTHVNTVIGAVNTSLQSLSKIASQVQSGASATPQNLTSTGQTTGQLTASSNLSAITGILNTQVGDRYIFSGSATDRPAIASADDILNGTATQAGLKQVIAERQQADLGLNGLGRLNLSASATMPITLAEDVAGSPFGFKLSSVTSSLTNATVTGPSGSPAGISVDLTAGNPNAGDQISFVFKLPDGTSESIKLTASTTTPAPTNTFAIGATPAATSANLNAALNTALTTLANTSLVAASAVTAGDNFFNTASSVSGTAVNNKAGTPAPITGATLLSGIAGTDSIATDFTAGDTITVNGQTLTFVASGANGNNQINVGDSVQTLLSKIDALSGTSKASTVSGGAITLRTDDAASFSVSSSNAGAFAALGFSGTVTAATPPLRVSGVPLGSATSLVNGSTSTVAWYTGNSGPGSARSSSTIRIDTAQSIQFGAQGNEFAIRNLVQQTAVYAAVNTPPAGANAPQQIGALSERIAANLTARIGQQSISDIQTEFANAQTTMKDAAARQTQAKAAMQALVDQTEGISQQEVAAQLLQLQTNLQASYQTTSMLSQLSLVKFL